MILKLDANVFLQTDPRTGMWPQVQGRMFAETVMNRVRNHAEKNDYKMPTSLEIDASRGRPDVLISSFFHALLTHVREQWPSMFELIRSAKWITQFEFQVTNIARWVMRPSSAVVLIRDGKIAAIRSKKHGGAFELPGGKGEWGEAAETTAIRECLEEVGVVPWIRELLFCESDVGGFECSTFYGTIPDSILLSSSSEGEAVWVTPEQMLTGTYSDHTRRWLKLPIIANSLSASVFGASVHGV